MPSRNGHEPQRLCRRPRRAGESGNMAHRAGQPKEGLHAASPAATRTGHAPTDSRSIERAIEYLGHVPTGEEIVHSIDLVVAQHGGEPHKKTPQVDEQVALQIFGLLFAPYPDR